MEMKQFYRNLNKKKHKAQKLNTDLQKNVLKAYEEIADFCKTGL